MDEHFGYGEFSAYVLPRPTPEPTFRRVVAHAAAEVFGAYRFFGEVWLEIEFLFHVYGKWQVRGDIDNYAKNVADALTGVAYIDDSQVSGMNAYWVDAPGPGVIVRVEGYEPFDSTHLEPMAFSARGERFGFLVPREDWDPVLRAKTVEFLQELLRQYTKMVRQGAPVDDARRFLPYSGWYPRRGPVPDV